MINLIPPSAKRDLVISYWLRAATVWLWLWGCMFLAGAAVLLPTYVLIQSQVTVYENSAAEASLRVADYRNASAALVEASQQAKEVIDEEELPRLTDYLTLFSVAQGDTISISTIGLARGETGIDPISVSGVAVDRQSLTAFRDRLLADERVASVDFPISNLARSQDIQFSITVEMKQAEL